MLAQIPLFLQSLNPGEETFGRPYHSVQGISNKGQAILFLIIVGYGLYIGIRVWWSLRKDKRNNK